MANSATENALYSPYGAYELKARYQRNFLIGTGSTASFVLLILLTFWVIGMLQDDDVVPIGTTVIKTVAELGPPPTVAKKPPQVQVQKPNVSLPKVGIPKPVADEEVLDDDVVLASREELAEIIAPDITASGDGDIVVDIAEEDYLPDPGEFVPVEIQPEMIYQAPLEYPRLAKEAGLTGRVIVQALVSKEGEVLDARVQKSSNLSSLDEAAVAQALKCRYKPAIQNGRPVAIWVSYKVDFVLNK